VGSRARAVVPTAVWLPSWKVTFLPATGSPYSSTSVAVAVTVFDGAESSGPV
jgi:hypothetical protein